MQAPAPSQTALRAAAAAIRQSDALLICSGAGMGVDSGLGTFRGRRLHPLPFTSHLPPRSPPLWLTVTPRV